MTNMLRHDGITRQHRIMRIMFSMFAALIMMLSLSMQASAASSAAFSVKDVYRLGVFIQNGSPIGDSTATITDVPAWEDILKLAGVEDKELPDADTEREAYIMYMTARSIVNTFQTSTAYTSATDGFGAVFQYTGQGDKLEAQEGKTRLFDTMQSDFAAKVASARAGSTFRDIYDMKDWDPSAGGAATVLGHIYGVVNTVFYVCSQLLMWFFILQTGFDVIYLVFEPVRPILEPRGGGSVGGLSATNAGGDAGILSKIRLPIASHAAQQAASGDSGGSQGGVNAMGSQNIFLSYAIKRFPVIILCAVYIILVSNGYWISVIEWVAGFVVRILNFFLQLGQ